MFSFKAIKANSQSVSPVLRWSRAQITTLFTPISTKQYSKKAVFCPFPHEPWVPPRRNLHHHKHKVSTQPFVEFELLPLNQRITSHEWSNQAPLDSHLFGEHGLFSHPTVTNSAQAILDQVPTRANNRKVYFSVANGHDKFCEWQQVWGVGAQSVKLTPKQFEYEYRPGKSAIQLPLHTFRSPQGEQYVSVRVTWD